MSFLLCVEHKTLLCVLVRKLIYKGKSRVECSGWEIVPTCAMMQIFTILVLRRSFLIFSARLLSWNNGIRGAPVNWWHMLRLMDCSWWQRLTTDFRPSSVKVRERPLRSRSSKLSPISDKICNCIYTSLHIWTKLKDLIMIDLLKFHNYIF